MTGSHVRVDRLPDLSGGLAFGVWVLPTLRLPEPQGILTLGDVRLVLRDGRMALGDLTLDAPLEERTWTFVSFSVDADGAATLAARPQSELRGGPPQRTQGAVAPPVLRRFLEG